VLERLPLGCDRPWLVYGGTSLICAVSIAVRLLVAPLMPVGYPFVTFIPTVMLATFLFGLRPGILAALICGVASWYCFLPPAFAMKFSRSATFAIAFFTAVITVNVALIHALQRINGGLAEERERNRRLAERGELLFRELQHRVSNNLQVVSGLLALQMRDISDEGARLALEESARRLGLIGRIHRQLYSPHGEQVQLSTFLRQLGADLIDAGGKPGIELQVKVDEEADLPSDVAVPVALIVAEAVTNAIEHGFAGRERGHILVRGIRVGDGLEIMVVDDGLGLPAGFALEQADSLGLKLARTLARQLGGEFTLSSGEGTIARLRLALS
jgi:two-component sensor histidine kinase